MMKKILLFSLVAGLIACTDSAQQSDATSGDERAERSAELREADERDDEIEDRRRPRQSSNESAEVDETDADRAKRDGDAELTHDRSGCAPAGCSGQICAEAGADIMTTCEFRPEYACYQRTACERQPSGECGWTETEELKECLRSAGSQRAVLE